MLDLNDLAMFVQVVRAGSFSEAARRLGMPANTLSRRIDQLEGQLGTRLLHRSTRKLAPSTEGQALFERYAPALDQILEIGTVYGPAPVRKSVPGTESNTCPPLAAGNGCTVAVPAGRFGGAAAGL